MNVSFQGKLYRDKYKNSRIIFEDVVAVFNLFSTSQPSESDNILAIMPAGAIEQINRGMLPTMNMRKQKD